MPTLDVAINALKAKYGADQFDAAIRKMQQGAVSLDRDLNRTEKSITGLGGTVDALAKRFTGLAAVYGVYRFFKESVQEAAKFETELARVSILLDEQTMSYLPKYRDELSKMAVKYGESTAVLSKGLQEIIAANVDAAKALDVLNVSAIAAIAGFSRVDAAAETLTTIIGAYGRSVDDAIKISDILFATMVRGKTTFDELAGSLGPIVSLAAASGLSFEELTAALATMTKAGISTDMAVTSLRSVLTTFIDPTEESIKAAKKWGFELNIDTLRTIGLTGVMKLLQHATAEQVSEIFGNIRALSGLVAILQQTDKFMNELAKTINSTGKTMEAYDKVIDTTSVKINQFKEAYKDLKRTTGEEFAPYFIPVLKDMTKLVPDVAGGLGVIAHGGQNIAACFGYVASSSAKLTSELLLMIPGMETTAAQAKQASEHFKKWAENTGDVNVNLGKLTVTTDNFTKEWQDFIQQMEAIGVDWRTLDRLDKNAANSTKLMERRGQITDENTLKFIENAKKQVKIDEEATEKAQGLIREVQLEREIMFLTNEERERAIKLNELEIATKGMNADKAKKLREEYMAELDKLREAQEMEKYVTAVTDSIGKLIETPLTALLDSTKDFGDLIEDELRNLGKSILAMLYQEMITAPLKKAATSFLAETLPMLFGAEKGIVVSKSGRLERFGLGGIVTKPTLFPMANGMALMGEKEPEAVMPLTRDKSGRLGVRAEGSQPETSLKIINVLDKSTFEDYLSSGAGERVIVNIMRRNQD